MALEAVTTASTASLSADSGDGDVTGVSLCFSWVGLMHASASSGGCATLHHVVNACYL